jgi:hypothetical protein
LVAATIVTTKDAAFNPVDNLHELRRRHMAPPHRRICQRRHPDLKLRLTPAVGHRPAVHGLIGDAFNFREVVAWIHDFAAGAEDERQIRVGPLAARNDEVFIWICEFGLDPGFDGRC